MKKKKRLSDETAAAIFAFIWEAFLYLGFSVELATGETWGYYLWFIDTAVQLTILIYDAKVHALEKTLNNTRRRLAKQSTEYAEYIKAHEQAETRTSTVTIFDIKSILDRTKKHNSSKRA